MFDLEIDLRQLRYKPLYKPNKWEDRVRTQGTQKILFFSDHTRRKCLIGQAY